MHILMIAPTPFFADRGTHIRILEEARALVRRGHRVTIATYHIGRNVDAEIPETIRVRRIWPLFFWYRKLEAGPSWEKLFLDLQLFFLTLWTVIRDRPDVLHAHLHEGIAIGWLVKKCFWWRKIVLVADIHGALTAELKSDHVVHGRSEESFLLSFERWIDRLGDQVITSSDENTAFVKRLAGRDDVETILDGVDVEQYRAADRRASREQLNLPNDKIIVVYTGAFLENKGTDYLFKAIASLVEQRKADDVFFVLAGSPIDPAEQAVKQYELKTHVRLISPLNYFQVPQLLMACDIAVDPKDSSVGQASGKMLQYMAAGLPVACFDRENNRVYLGAGDHLAATVSGDGLAAAILYYVDHSNARATDGARHRERVASFSWDRAAEQCEKMYSL